MKYVPNILSTLRLALCPVFVLTFFAKSPEMAFFVFGIASLLDVADGFLARKFNCISNYGKIMDPLADKILQISGILCLTIAKIINNWYFIGILAAKELTMLIGGLIISKKKNELVYSNIFGKASSFVMSISICLMFFASPNGILFSIKPVLNWIIYIALALSVASMVQYGIIAIRKK